MPYAFVVLFGFLLAWSQMSSENFHNTQERTTHAQTDSVLSAVVYYGQYIRDVAAYRRTDGTQPNLGLVRGHTGATNALLSQIRSNGNMPERLAWFSGIAGLDGYLDAANQNLWVYFHVPTGTTHVLESSGGIAGIINKKAIEKYGEKILAGQVRTNAGGNRQVYPSLMQATAYPDAVPSVIPVNAAVYRIRLNLD